MPCAASLGLYGAGLVSYFVAATGTWLFNRLWTFRGRGSGPAHRQWARFLAANLLGFTLNRGTYALLVTFVALCARPADLRHRRRRHRRHVRELRHSRAQSYSANLQSYAACYPYEYG